MQLSLKTLGLLPEIILFENSRTKTEKDSGFFKHYCKSKTFFFAFEEKRLKNQKKTRSDYLDF